MGRHTVDWTEDKLKKLTKLWADGHTADECARELGGVGMTKNAVIGKVHRLGLHNLPRKARPPKPRKRGLPRHKVIRGPSTRPIKTTPVEPPKAVSTPFQPEPVPDADPVVGTFAPDKPKEPSGVITKPSDIPAETVKPPVKQQPTQKPATGKSLAHSKFSYIDTGPPTEPSKRRLYDMLAEAVANTPKLPPED